MYLSFPPVSLCTNHQHQFLYTPQFTVSLLTAVAVANTPDSLHWVVPIHVGAWIAQFVGHGFAEKRSPALLDNLVGGNSTPISYIINSPANSTSSFGVGTLLRALGVLVQAWLPPRLPQGLEE